VLYGEEGKWNFYVHIRKEFGDLSVMVVNFVGMN